MMHRRHKPLYVDVIGILILMTIIQACVPVFSDGEFQTLKLSFRLGREIDAGQIADLQTVVFPEEVKVAKRWLQISGRISPAGGADPPRQITVEAKLQDLATGRPGQRLLIKLKVDSDGIFSGKKKIKQDIAAGEMMGLTLQPSGEDISANTEITLCVDLVQKKTDLDTLPACTTGGDGSGDNPVASFDSIQNSVFTPTCALSGCHNEASASAGLVLASGQSYGNLVNVPSTEVPSFDRVEPGDPERSYLIKKLRGDADITGDRMPRGGAPLSSSQIDSIVQWIAAGALNN